MTTATTRAIHRGAPIPVQGAPMEKAPMVKPQNPPAKRLPWKGDASLTHSGAGIAMEIINSADFSRLQKYVDDANSPDENIRQSGLSVLAGVGMTFASVLISLRGGGRYKFHGAPMLTSDDVFYAIKTDVRYFSRTLNSLVTTMGRVLDADSSFKVSFANQAGRNSGSAQGSAEPMEVKVVSMPARHSVTNITHNMAGEIVQAEQIEADL